MTEQETKTPLPAVLQNEFMANYVCDFDYCDECEKCGREVNEAGSTLCDDCDPTIDNNRDERGNWIGPVRNENGWTP